MSGIFVLNSAMPTLIPWAFTSTLLILAVLSVGSPGTGCPL